MDRSNPTKKAVGRQAAPVLLAILAILVVGSLAGASGNAPASKAGYTALLLQAQQPQPGREAAVPVSTSFTYQGRLKDGVRPVSGQYEFQFRLFNSIARGAQVGGTINSTQVVTDGLVVANLDFGSSAFNGQARYLEVAVRPQGSPNFTILTPRQAVSPAPYAMGLRPGTVITDSDRSLQFLGPSVGLSLFSSGGDIGLFAASNTGTAVQGESSTGAGVHGHSTTSIGVHGTSLESIGVRGDSDGSPGVQGTSDSGSGVDGASKSGTGVSGASNTGTGVEGVSGGGTGVEGLSGNGDGVLGTSGGGGAGVRGKSLDSYGVFGESTRFIGVYGIGNDTGVYGEGGDIGVFGTGSDLAGKFQGDVEVTGNLSKGGGSFKIDHPLDPANKYLYHSFVESPDMMNVYNGNVTTNARGEAIVTLPDYFQTLNKDFRYQLTVVGQFAQAIVWKKIEDNRFTIKTDKPDVEVSWQVTGIRRDAYAEKHRIPVEEDKGEDRGKYLHPEEHGQLESMGIGYEELQRVEEKP